jgi:hypothetical protein
VLDWFLLSIDYTGEIYAVGGINRVQPYDTIAPLRISWIEGDGQK